MTQIGYVVEENLDRKKEKEQKKKPEKSDSFRIQGYEIIEGSGESGKIAHYNKGIVHVCIEVNGDEHEFDIHNTGLSCGVKLITGLSELRQVWNKTNYSVKEIIKTVLDHLSTNEIINGGRWTVNQIIMSDKLRGDYDLHNHLDEVASCVTESFNPSSGNYIKTWILELDYGQVD